MKRLTAIEVNLGDVIIDAHQARDATAIGAAGGTPPDSLAALLRRTLAFPAGERFRSSLGRIADGKASIDVRAASGVAFAP